MMKLFIIFSFFLFFPFLAFGQTFSEEQAQTSEMFEARVLRILEEREIQREDGTFTIQQNILLEGLRGEWKGEEVYYEGISVIDVLDANVYEEGDKVLVLKSENSEGETYFYLMDFVRRNALYLLLFLFCLVTILVGKVKGFKALLGLAVSFLIIIKMILPGILGGGNPLVWGAAGSFFILLFLIYLTEGWNQKSHIAMVSIFFSLLAVIILSWLFSGWAHLSGYAQEETMFLIGIGNNIIDFKGLVLAGMLIGAIGVLDDVVVNQIETVQQMKKANPFLSPQKIYEMAHQVGKTHMGAIVNTLFLTYAGASLPLLLLFVVREEPFLTFSQILNHEMIATELIRTLVGSIGVALSMPLSTFLASRILKKEPKVE